MTQADKIANGKNEFEAEVSAAKKRIYKITSDSFAAQIKEMDHKTLFAINGLIEIEISKRQAEAEALVAELKGGKA